MASKKRDHITFNKALNRFQGRYMVTLPNGTRKRQAVYGKTLEEAREKYTLAVAKAVMGVPIQTTTITVGQYLTDWIETVGRIRESTRDGYRGEIRKYIIPHLGGVKLSCLTSQQVQQMMNRVRQNGASVRTTQILRNILSKALRPAESQGLVKRDLMRYVELDVYKPKERAVWSEEEGKAFLEAAKNHEYYLFFLMYMTYGLRRGEPIPLTWDDIDFEAKTIRIDKQYTYHGRRLVICPPKTNESIRVLPLLPHVEKALLEIKEKAFSPTTALIISINGEPVKPSSIDYEFKRITKGAGLPSVVLHSLRHFVATMLKESEVTIKDAQMILGHASPLTTMQFYQHSSTESKRVALTKYAEKMQF